MTAASEGRIDVQPVAPVWSRIRAEAEPNERFLDKHRNVLIQLPDPRDAPMSKRQRIEFGGQIGRGLLALEPRVALFVPARLVLVANHAAAGDDEPSGDDEAAPTDA